MLKETRLASGGRGESDEDIQMADVLAPTQKLDGQTAAPAGPPLVDLSKLDATSQKTAAQTTDAQAASQNSVLTQLTLTDNAAPAPTKVADNAPAPAQAQTDAIPQPAPAAAPTADVQTGAVSADNCDKSSACSFTPTTDREKSKPWWDARAQLVGTNPEKDANCLYTVKFGDDLSTIAQRQLHAEGKAVNAASLKAEEDKIVKLNDAQYKSLDCNKHYLQAGWRLKLDDQCTTDTAPAPAQPPCDTDKPQPRPQQAVEPPCDVDRPQPRVERQPCDDARGGDYRNADHIFQTPGHHIILRHNGCENTYDVPPGKSIVYDDGTRQRMITVCNEDGSKPQHSEILYEIDRNGNRIGLSDQQKDDCYQRFEPAYRANYDDQDYVPAPAQIPSQDRAWQQDDQGQSYYEDQGRRWYEDQQGRDYYNDRGRQWYADQSGRDYFEDQGRRYYEDQNRVYYENQGQRIYIDQSVQNNFFNGAPQDQYSIQEHRANEAQRRHDEEVRRAQAQQNQEQPVPVPAAPPHHHVRVIPDVTQVPAPVAPPAPHPQAAVPHPQAAAPVQQHPDATQAALEAQKKQHDQQEQDRIAREKLAAQHQQELQAQQAQQQQKRTPPAPPAAPPKPAAKPTAAAPNAAASVSAIP